MIEERYSKNLGALTPAEIELLRKKRACVVGCGGIGGYVIELLARIGIGAMTVIDGDDFAVSNLNRQMLSSEELIGKNKALAAKKRVQSVNSGVRVDAISSFITEENADGILKNHDIVMDALDNVPDRRILADSCERLGIPLIHGAISGWCAQVAVIVPGSGGMDRIYSSENGGVTTPSLSFTPALAASIEAAEAVKVLLGRETPLRSKLLYADMLTHEYNVIAI